MYKRQVHVGNQEKIEKAVKKEIEILHKNADTIEQYRLATMEIVSGFYRFCANNSIDFNGISKDMQSNYEKVPEMDESTLAAWLIEVSMTISNMLKNARNSTSRRLVTEAQNLVKNRYMEAEISLDEVCSVLGVSNSYFSSVFKKETGKPFITYLDVYKRQGLTVSHPTAQPENWIRRH